MYKDLSNFNIDNIDEAEHVPNELDARLVGIPALNPFFRGVSGPRAAMFNKHISQRPTLIKSDKQRLMTGVATELGKYTYKKELPAGAYVIDVIAKYGASINRSIDFQNPLTTVIYEDPETREIDALNLTRFHSNHQYFGFEYKYDTDALREIIPRKRIHTPLIIADSPAKRDGEYAFGVHANIALSSEPVGNEDGIMISESFAQRLAFELFETRTLHLTNDLIPLNMYGDNNRYKIFPNIGDRIRQDGIIFATREYSQDTAPAEMSVKALQTPNMYDTCVFGKPNAEIVDIEIIRGDNAHSSMLSGMDEQVLEHYDVSMYYHKRIYEIYRKLVHEYGHVLKLSNRFHTLVKTAYAHLNTNQNKLSSRGKSKISGWLINIVYKYRMIPKLGYKITNTMG